MQGKYTIPLTRAMSHYREIMKKASTAKAHAAVRDFIVENPTLSYEQIADALGCSRWLVYTVASEFNVRRPRGAGSPVRRQK